jgi:hypothetical protein
MYESPDGRCFNGILGTYYARRGASRLTHGIIVSLRPDKTVISSHAFELGSRYHKAFLIRAVNGEPAAMYSQYRFDVPIVAPSRDDSPHIADVRKALRDRLVVEFAVRRSCARLPVNAWFSPHSNIRGPVAALLVVGYSTATEDL